MNNGIHIKINNAEIQIPLYDKITVITGDSASGKTKMLNFLRACKSEANVVQSSVNMDDIIIVSDKYAVDSIIKNNEQHKIIFIDRFNILVSDKLMRFIQTSENIFILIGHRDTSELASQGAVLRMKCNGDNYICEQVYKNGLLNPLELI